MRVGLCEKFSKSNDYLWNWRSLTGLPWLLVLFVGGSYEGAVIIQYFVSNYTNYFWKFGSLLRVTRGDVSFHDLSEG